MGEALVFQHQGIGNNGDDPSVDDGGHLPNILVVDDEPAVVKSLKKFLVLKGFEVITAMDGEAALRTLSKRKDIDLVILDSKMPKMSGTDVLKAIRKSDPKLPVIMLSGDIELSGNRLNDFLELGCEVEDVISKPVSLFLIEGVIRKKLGLS